jgi:hypothetical protein
MLNLKLIHLLLDPNYPEDIPQDKWESIMKKQEQSISSIKNIVPFFKTYTQQYSKINRTELPKEEFVQWKKKEETVPVVNEGEGDRKSVV